MKFGETLLNTLIPEWKDQYLDYKRLKKVILCPLPDDCKEDTPEAEVKRQEFRHKLDNQFWEVIREEMAKINKFYQGKVVEANQKYSQLVYQVSKFKYNLAGDLPHELLPDDSVLDTHVNHSLDSPADSAPANELPPDHPQQQHQQQQQQQNIEHPIVNFDNVPTIDRSELPAEATITKERGLLMHRPTHTTNRFLVANYKKKSKNQQKSSKKLAKHAMAVSEFYLSLIHLNNYQQLNYTGFRKILKKYDKNFEVHSGYQYFVNDVTKADFFADDSLSSLILATENLYITEFADGDRSKGMNELRVPSLTTDREKISWSSFFTGVFALYNIILVVLIVRYVNILRASTDAKHQDFYKDFQQVFVFFRGQITIVFMVLLISFNIYGWRHSGVNHVLIFEINPRNNMKFSDLLWVGLMLLSIVLTCLFSFVFYYESFAFNISYFPIFSLAAVIAFMLNPIPIFYKSGRYWLLKVMLINVAAGFVHVKFADFWLGDQMTSLNSPIQDVQENFSYLILGPSSFSYESGFTTKGFFNFFLKYLMLATPHYIRFAQCIKRYYDKPYIVHIYNMFKYLSSIVLLFFLALNEYYTNNKVVVNTELSAGIVVFMFLMIARAVNTLYLLTWDVCVDWTLFERYPWLLKRNSFKIRKNRIYKHKGYYIAASALDLMLRMVWLFSMFNRVRAFVPVIYYDLLAQLLEATRRFVWNFFRLENEHLNNVGGYRNVRNINFIPIPREAMMKHAEGKLDKNE